MKTLTKKHLSELLKVIKDSGASAVNIKIEGFEISASFSQPLNIYTPQTGCPTPPTGDWTEALPAEEQPFAGVYKQMRDEQQTFEELMASSNQ